MSRLAGAKRTTLITIAAATVVVIAVSIVFAVLAINRAGVFAQRIDDHCEPFVVIAFRGSGEPNLNEQVTTNKGEPFQYGDSQLVTNGWESITLTHLFDELAHTSIDEFRADSIPVVPVGPAGDDQPFGYDAIMAVLEASSISSALSYPNSKLLYSATRGAEAATHLINDYLEASQGCPIQPKFALVGYSQGAMAARHTAELNPESVIAVLNIGDPYQKPNAPGVRDEGSAGVGIIRWKTNDEQSRLLDAFYGSMAFSSSICHAGDPICEFSPVEGLLKLATGNYDTHMDYYTDAYPGEAEEDAAVLARLGYERWLLAQEAADRGEQVTFDAAATGGGALRTLSLAFPGTPTLVSAMHPGLIGRDLNFDFDLDGDGVFETVSENGLVWVTFDDEGTQTIGVRVTEPDGTVHEQTATVQVAPSSDAQTPLEEPAPPASQTPAQQTPAEEPPAPISQVPASVPPVVPAPPATPTTPTTPAAPAPAPPAPVIPTPPAPAPLPEDPPAEDEEPPVEDEEPPAEEEPPVEEEPPGQEEPPAEEEPPVEDEDPPTDEGDASPTLTITPVPMSPGDVASVRGEGYPPEVYVMLVSEQLEIWAEARTDDMGMFESEVWVPADATPGVYELRIESAEFDSELEGAPWLFEITVGQ